jgi:hypothetical protein
MSATSPCCIVAKGKLKSADYLRALFVTYRCGLCGLPLDLIGGVSDE